MEYPAQQSQRYRPTKGTGGAERLYKPYAIKSKRACKIQLEKNAGTTLQVDSLLLTRLPRHAAWHYTRFHRRQEQPQNMIRFDTCHIRTQSCPSERQLRSDGQEQRSPSCNQHGSSAFGSDVTAEQLRSRALKRRVERRRWDTTLLNAMIWDSWKPTPVTRGRPPKVRSDREPILMGPIPRVQFNPPDDPDTVTTATAAVPSQEITPMGEDTICHRTNACEASRG